MSDEPAEVAHQEPLSGAEPKTGDEREPAAEPTTITFVRRYLSWVTAVSGVVLLALSVLVPYRGPGTSMALTCGLAAIVSGGRSIWLRRSRPDRPEAPSDFGAAVSLFSFGSGIFAVPYLFDYSAEGRFELDPATGFSTEALGGAATITLLLANGLAGLLAWWAVD
ncbi:hypothetical protein [Actinokineospora sp. NBRC 105648]|uniref:hypothetical protein n=1 Tax=Actinokineospora sp. NBRC 105648 TaxID=3032206 RepID=UPI0024A52E10|nr:hypothetical protein [Actinokineospora sp. NBRC 105648]GLZ43686.1 hypothetical protein Acsp05_73100 [Actinokineospora sp. NBRC 105648]